MQKRILLFLLLGVTLKAALAEPGDELEYPVKAAMIYNFTRFVEWPPAAWRTPQEPMVVGVLGSGPAERALAETLRGKSYAGRNIQVTRLHGIENIPGCHVLFVAASEKKHLPEILRLAHGSGILTVSDIPDFVASGGVIGFLVEDQRVRFEIGAAAARQAGLVISSKLLNLATGQGGK